MYRIVDFFADFFDVFFGAILEWLGEGAAWLFDKTFAIPGNIQHSWLDSLYYIKCRLSYRHRIILNNRDISDEEWSPQKEWAIEQFGEENIFLYMKYFFDKERYYIADYHYNFKRKNDAVHFKMVWKV